MRLSIRIALLPPGHGCRRRLRLEGLRRALWLAVVSGLPLAVFPCRSATTTVAYGSFFFNPRMVTVNVGDTVVWTNGSGFHTVMGTGADLLCAGAALPCFYTFDAPGNFPYRCTVDSHAAFGMTGMVMVASGPPEPPLLTNLARLPKGEIEFTVLTTANQTNIVQATTNLSGGVWVSLSTNLPAGSAFVFRDSNASAFPFRFYRVVAPP